VDGVAVTIFRGRGWSALPTPLARGVDDIDTFQIDDRVVLDRPPGSRFDAERVLIAGNTIPGRRHSTPLAST